MPKPFGFTLIELLITIAIISILTGIGIVAFSGVQKSARDAKRKADVDAIIKAYEAKYDYNKGEYVAIVDSDFTSGKPTEADGIDYYTDFSGGNKALVVCSNRLEKDSPVYCKYSANGDISTLETPAPYAAPTPTPIPTATPTPAPTAPSCSNLPQSCRVWGPSNGETIYIDCSSAANALNCTGNANNNGVFTWYRVDGSVGAASVFFGEQYSSFFPLVTVRKR